MGTFKVLEKYSEKLCLSTLQHWLGLGHVELPLQALDA